MSATLGAAPGFRRHPQHQIEIRAAATRWQASHGNDLLADSSDALLLHESQYAPVVYFPRADVKLGLLVATDSKTTCPFKGEANYYRIATTVSGDDIAWSYAVTYNEVSPIAGHVAFYADRVLVTEAEN